MNTDFTKVYDIHKESDCLPCPFCGSGEIATYKYNHAAGIRYGIFCTGCMAEINPGWAQERGAVIEMWNKKGIELAFESNLERE